MINIITTAAILIMLSSLLRTALITDGQVRFRVADSPTHRHSRLLGVDSTTNGQARVHAAYGLTAGHAGLHVVYGLIDSRALLHVATAASAERPQLSISNAPVHVQELVDVRADQLLGAWESHLG